MIYVHLSALRLCCQLNECTALEALPAMQRRRLSPLAKLAIHVAIETLKEHSVDYIIWVSKYADEAKTLSILKDVLTDQTPSPTQFSTSVHNAIGGLYSILCKDATVSTSISGSWSQAVIDAYARLKTDASIKKVMVVCYEAPLPDIYQDTEDFDAFALSSVISLAPANAHIHSLEDESELDALKFYQFWQDHTQTELLGWQKC